MYREKGGRGRGLHSRQCQGAPCPARSWKGEQRRPRHSPAADRADLGRSARTHPRMVFVFVSPPRADEADARSSFAEESSTRSARSQPGAFLGRGGTRAVTVSQRGLPAFLSPTRKASPAYPRRAVKRPPRHTCCRMWSSCAPCHGPLSRAPLLSPKDGIYLDARQQAAILSPGPSLWRESLCTRRKE